MQTLQLRQLKKPTERERLNVTEKKELSRPESEVISKLVGTKREMTFSVFTMSVLWLPLTSTQPAGKKSLATLQVARSKEVSPYSLISCDSIGLKHWAGE